MGYDPNQPVGKPYGFSGPTGSVPGQGGQSAGFGGGKSPFNSTQPVMPPIDIPSGGSGDCHGLPSWICSAGSAIGSGLGGIAGIGGLVGKFLPHDKDGNIDWGKLAGLGVGAAGVATAYENGKNQSDYLNKIMKMKEDQIAAGQADYARRAPVRSAVEGEVTQKIANRGNNIFSKYTGQ